MTSKIKIWTKILSGKIWCFQTPTASDKWLAEARGWMSKEKKVSGLLAQTAKNKNALKFCLRTDTMLVETHFSNSWFILLENKHLKSWPIVNSAIWTKRTCFEIAGLSFTKSQLVKVSRKSVDNHTFQTTTWILPLQVCSSSFVSALVSETEFARPTRKLTHRKNFKLS